VHGTSDDASIGSNASHGCIRMHIPDVEELYPEVPIGSPIYIA
jgi:lipoprotein-anchoring transpeptidase ErfK/SrfK